MKALFFGLGSVGQRHLMNLRSLLGDTIEIYAHRSSPIGPVIVNGQLISSTLSLEDYYGIKVISDIDAAWALRPELVFITNPTAMHLGIAIEAARRGCSIYIEKPISHNLDQVDELLRLVKQQGSVVSVGYQTRYHPAILKVSELLSSLPFGGIISASFEWGTYLPVHHRYEDYRVGYAANRSLGGGVSLGLSHEFDLIHSFWGQPDDVMAMGGHFSKLEMNSVDDTVMALLKYSIHGRTFPVSVYLSYAQVKESRHFEIRFDEALLSCNLVENTLQVFGKENERLLALDWPDFARNQLFVDAIKDFIWAVKGRAEPRVTLRDGIGALALAQRVQDGSTVLPPDHRDSIDVKTLQ